MPSPSALQESPAPQTAADGAAARELPYLAALDGLRAVAIALVLVYHLRPALLPGGFIGVDVFFVISGFLICAPIIRAIETDATVDPGAFLFRRARRLLPAVFVVVAVTSVALAQLPTTDLHRLRRHAVSSLSYGMNWTLVSERLSYTDLIEGASPLRHMWSLAIEEQFYVVVAVLLLAWATVRGRIATNHARRVIAAVAAGLAVCGAIAMWLHAANPQQNARAYYGTDTRAQTLLVGIVAAAVIDPWARGARRRAAGLWTCVAVVMLALVARSANEQSTLLYRGGFLLVAVASGALVAGALHDRWLSAVLSRRPVVLVGRLSYSLYLWHWPVIVFARRRWPDAPGFASDLSILATTVALAGLTFALVEQPARRRLGRAISMRASIGVLAAAGAIALAVVMSTTRTDAVEVTAPTPDRATAPPAAPVATFADASTHDVDPAASPTERRVIIVGDSMAHTLAGGRVADFPNFTAWTPDDSSFAGTSLDVVSLAQPACSFLGGEVAYVRPDGTWYSADLGVYCADWRDQLNDLLRSTPTIDAVVVALSNDVEDRAVDGHLVDFGSTEYVTLLREFLDSVDEMLPAGTRLVLVAGAPRSPAPDTDPAGWREIEMRSILRGEVARRPGAVFLDLGELVCPRDDCDRPADGFAPGGRSDGLHFTPTGARQAAAWLAGQLEARLSG